MVYATYADVYFRYCNPGFPTDLAVLIHTRPLATSVWRLHLLVYDAYSFLPHSNWRFSGDCFFFVVCVCVYVCVVCVCVYIYVYVWDSQFLYFQYIFLTHLQLQISRVSTEMKVAFVASKNVGANDANLFDNITCSFFFLEKKGCIYITYTIWHILLWHMLYSARCHLAADWRLKMLLL